MKTNNLKSTISIVKPNDKENFSRYLVEISKTKPLSREEEIETFKLIEAGDESAIEKICQHNLRFVVSVAKKYATYLGSSSLTLEDLISEGNLGLFVAIRKFNYHTGNKFISYAVWWIKRYILSCIQDNVKSIRIPVNVRKVANKINKKEEQLEQILSRKPTTLEIFETMLEDEELTKKNTICDLDNIIIGSKYETSLDIFVGDDETTQLSQLIKCNDDLADDQLIGKERKELILKILDRIPQGIQNYFIDFYGIGGADPLNYREIGEKYQHNPVSVKVRMDKWLRRMRSRNRTNRKFYFPNTSQYFW